MPSSVREDLLEFSLMFRDDLGFFVENNKPSRPGISYIPLSSQDVRGTTIQTTNKFPLSQFLPMQRKPSIPTSLPTQSLVV